MIFVAGLVVIAALVVLAGGELRAARLGLQRQSQKEWVVLGVVFLVGASAAALRLLIALRVV